MSAEQSTLFDDSASAWRDYESDPVAHLRHLPIPEQLKRCAARFAWQCRTEICPKTQEFRGEVRYVNWAEWFEARFEQSLSEFQLSIRQKG